MKQEINLELSTLSKVVSSWGIAISDEAVEKLARYRELIKSNNDYAGLVSSGDVDKIVPRHFLESLSLAREINFHATLLAMDFGCGAGFPSLPLKIVFPEFHLYLVESKRKKHYFLDEVIRELNLHNVTLLRERGEELHSVQELLGVFDIAMARAVGPLMKIVPWILPFLDRRGKMILPGARTDDLSKVEQRYQIWGGIRKIVLHSDTLKLPGARDELEFLELRLIGQKNEISFS